MFWTKVVEKIKIHILCSITFFDHRATFQIMWKNILETDRPQMTIQRMRIAYLIPKATNTHSEYVILIVFSLQHWYVKRTLPVMFTCPSSHPQQIRIISIDGTYCPFQCLLFFLDTYDTLRYNISLFQTILKSYKD
jgi:hypothetical protein